MAWFLILLVFLATDTVEVKGTRGLTYRVFVYNGILYFQCKAGDNWFKPTVLDSGDCSSPSIAISPKGYLHVVWQRKRENTQSVYYEATLDKVTPTIIYETQGNLDWSEKYPVSYWPDYPTEPASNPFVEAYGDKVFVTWRGPYNETNEIGEIWR
ncbi:MAG: hypothetical protein OEW70_08695, partial [candidate division WOR-3 bacterium]|nr:hypothetical protein [candidate division WOR-3 bacterium]